MAESISSKLQLWNNWESASTPDAVSGGLFPGSQPPLDFLHSVFVQEALIPSGLRDSFDDSPPPLTLQWFLELERLRHHRYGRWIPATLEFSRHAAETMLCVGPGLGTDWVQFARHGAHVLCCSDPQHLP